jgi:hypothetical protein
MSRTIRRKVKLLWSQVQSQINGNDLNSERHEVSRHFRSKEGEYLKYKSNEFPTKKTENKSLIQRLE